MENSAPFIDTLGKLLDVASLRQRVIAQNVANVNTPGYRRLEVTFEDALAKELGGGTGGRPPQADPKVVEAPGGAERVDGNNVDIDVEMTRLNKNSVLFAAFSQVLAVRLDAMRSAISGR